MNPLELKRHIGLLFSNAAWLSEEAAADMRRSLQCEEVDVDLSIFYLARAIRFSQESARASEQLTRLRGLTPAD